MKRTTLLRWIGIPVLMTLVLAGALILQSAFAQSPTPTATGQATPTPSSDHTGPRGTTGRGQGPWGMPWGGKGPGGMPGGGMWSGGMRGPNLMGALLKATADVTGLTSADVMTAVKGGKSLADIAKDHGKTADDVVNAAMSQLKTTLDQQVKDSKLTQDQADQRLSQARTQATTLVSQTMPAGGKGPWGGKGPGGPGGRGPGMQAGRMQLISTTAEVTGLTVDQVQTELKSGKSLAQIAQDHGKTADDIINALRTKGEDLLNKLLDQARTALNQPGGK